MTTTETAEIAARRLHENDTGSADVQVALLTNRLTTLTEHLKGNAPFQRIPINLTGDKQKHTPQLLKRIAPDLPVIVGVKKQADGKFMMLVFTNGTWFQVLGQTEDAQTRWAFTHCEIYLRRTFSGMTDDLKKIITEALAGTAKAPPANPKEPPGFGPVIGPTKGP